MLVVTYVVSLPIKHVKTYTYKIVHQSLYS